MSLNVGTMVLVLAAYHCLAKWGRQERYEHATAVGYSCVVFGWMTVLSVKQPTHSFSLLGRGLHSLTSELNLRTFGDTSLTLELNLSSFGTHPRVNLGYMGDNVSLS
jgi:hypothetical protein